MRKTALMMIVLAVVVCVGAVAQEAKPWTKPGTAAGQEIVGLDGGKLVWVPAGSFRMGSTDAEVDYAYDLAKEVDSDAKREWFEDEQPARQVEMDGFWMGKHEVTNAQYRAFCAATERQFPERSDQADEHPVVYVSRHDAVAYCEHYGLSLPTEAQWEYAARGRESRIFPWGNEWDGSRLYWFNNLGPGGKTFPVGSFPQGASWCEALDMAGNVWEWCADWYQKDYYKSAPSRNPPGPSSGSCHVLRGGSWFNVLPGFSRSAYRSYLYFPWYRYDFIGFRCARGL